jgi:hypothetical protein
MSFSRPTGSGWKSSWPLSCEPQFMPYQYERFRLQSGEKKALLDPGVVEIDDFGGLKIRNICCHQDQLSRVSTLFYRRSSHANASRMGLLHVSHDRLLHPDLPTVQTSSKIWFRRCLQTVKTGTLVCENRTVKPRTVRSHTPGYRPSPCSLVSTAVCIAPTRIPQYG